MKSRSLMGFVASTCLAALTMPIRLAAEDAHKTHHHYKLIDTGTLGGSFSSLGFEGERDLNNRGDVVSLAETTIPDPTCFNAPLDPTNCLVAHAVLWRNGVLSDLGAFTPGDNSGPIWISDSGLVVGFSTTGVIDPLLFGMPEFRAALFTDGKVVDLGNFGGNESIASGVNNRGVVVGCATTATRDNFRFCLGAPQQSRAFLWKDGKMTDLGTLGGPDALAELVNDQGEVAGFSLIDSMTATQHLFLWKDGNMRDLGNLGGTFVQLINGMNDRGQIVGGMSVVGDQSDHPFFWDGVALRDLGTFGGDSGSANWVNEAGQVVGEAQTAGSQASHAFLWQKGVLTDLGTVDGDPNSSSAAFVVNSKGQVVGASQNNNLVAAFLWERGSIADLNTLIPAASGVQLTFAVGLNDRGEIAAQGVLSNGDLHAFLLIPCDEDHPGIEGCDYNPLEVSTVAASHATEAQKLLTPQERSRIRDLSIKRHRGFMPTSH